VGVIKLARLRKGPQDERAGAYPPGDRANGTGMPASALGHLAGLAGEQAGLAAGPLGAARPPGTAGQPRTARPAPGASPPLTTARPAPGSAVAPVTDAARPQGGGGGQAANVAAVARGGSLNLLGALVAALATFGGTALVTNFFSGAEAGAFFTATSAFVIVESLAGLGANVGLVYFIARFRAMGEANRIPVVLRAGIIPVIVTGLLLTAAMFAFANPLAHFLLSSHTAKKGATPGDVADALRGLALAVPFASLVDTFLGATRGYGAMRPTVFIDRMFDPIGQLVAALIAVGLGSAALLAPLWALPYVPAAVASWWWLRRIRRKPPRKPSLPDMPPELAMLMSLATPSASALGAASAQAARAARGAGASLGRMARRRLASENRRAFWRFTMPRAAASLTSTIIQRLDIVLVAIMRGPFEAALYTAATRFLVLGQFGATAISRASQPRLTELFARKDRRGTNVVYQATTAWLILLTWPIYLLVMVYGPLVLAVFGHDYKAGYSVMLVLSGAQLISAVVGQVDIVLVTAGKSSWSLINGMLVLSTNVALDLWLIPKMGILGAAIGWAVAITVSNVVPLTQLAVVFKLHPFGRGSFVAAALCTLTFGAVPLAVHLALPGYLGLAVGAVLGSALALVGLARCRRSLKLQGMPGVSALQKRWPGRFG
jgi:O-antigen/teichoic acid export membrane protein